MPKRAWKDIDWTGLVANNDGKASASKIIFLLLGATAAIAIMIAAVRTAFSWEEILAVIAGTSPGVASKWVASRKSVAMARVQADAAKIEGEAG